jgi:hypothetical protein
MNTSTQSKRAASRRGDFISEDAVRGALSRRRRIRQAGPADAVDSAGRTVTVATAAAAQSPSARRAGPLRRWSVAELMARAAARPVDGMSR